MMKNKNAGMLDYFSVLVIGDNPNDKIFKYDSMIESDNEYKLYNYSDINKLRIERIRIYEELLKASMLNSRDSLLIKNKISDLRSMSDEEYYTDLASLHGYDSEKNIVTRENPLSKWITCEIGGRMFSNYIFDLNGNPTCENTKDGISWDLVHMNQDRVNTYSNTWDLIINKKEPSNERDTIIVSNMKKYKSIIESFGSKKLYVKYNCSFWTYAIIDRHGMWFDMEGRDEVEWICGFYDKHIRDLKGDTKITIYECTI